MKSKLELKEKSKNAEIKPLKPKRNINKAKKYSISLEKKRGQWSKECMQEAINLVIFKKIPIKTASIKYNIPYTTLNLHLAKEKAKINANTSNNNNNNNLIDADNEDEFEDCEEAESDGGFKTGPEEPDNHLEILLTSDKTTSSEDEEVREIFIEVPRASMARKSTSPMKFFVNNYFKNKTNSSIVK
jgi:hypothetical protein